MEQRRIPDIIGPQTLVTLTPRDCAHDAAQLMTTHRISAILVVEGDCLVGICTERDIVIRVVADGSAVGIFSVCDLHAAVMAGLQADLEERDAFIAGIGPGGLN